MTGRTQSYHVNLLWIITVHRESPEQLTWCIGHILAAYPEVRIIVIADGVFPGIPHRLHGVFWYRPDDWLKRLCFGALWWDRLFATALALDDWDVVLKLDPDSCVRRPFNQIPDADFFGHIRDAGTADEHVQGACQGFSRRFAEKVIATGIARHPRYTDKENWIAGPRGRAWLKEQPEGYLSIDATINKIAAALEFKAVDWPEVTHTPQDMIETQFAVTHPHKI